MKKDIYNRIVDANGKSDTSIEVKGGACDGARFEQFLAFGFEGEETHFLGSASLYEMIRAHKLLDEKISGFIGSDEIQAELKKMLEGLNHE